MQRILILLMVVLGACSNWKEENLMPREDFVNVLVDLHLFDAIVTDHSLKAQLNDIDSTILYSSILKKHNTDRAKFDETLKWYTSQPKLIAEVYDEVFGIINKKDEELSHNLALFNRGKTHEIWKWNNYILLIGDTVKYPDPYVIETKGVGKYLLEIKIRMLKDDKSVAPYLIAYFFKDKSDDTPENRIEITNIPIIKSNFSRDYQFITYLDDESYKYIKIILPETVSREKLIHKNLQISSIRVLKEEEIGEQINKKIK